MTQKVFIGGVIAFWVIILGLILSPTMNSMFGQVGTTGLNNFYKGVLTLFPYIFIGFVILFARSGNSKGQ